MRGGKINFRFHHRTFNEESINFCAKESQKLDRNLFRFLTTVTYFVIIISIELHFEQTFHATLKTGNFGLENYSPAVHLVI